MTNNHPSRNWRRRRDAALAAWLETTTAKCLIEIPVAAERLMDALRERVKLAYQAGYEAGRRDGK